MNSGPPREPVIRVDSLSHRAHQRDREIEVLQNVSLTVDHAEFVCIVGPSGCGKTTLLHMIGGLPPHHPPTSGTIFVDGEAVRRPGRDRVLVFQDHAVYPWLTVEQNILFGISKDLKGSAEANDLLERYLTLTKLEPFRKTYPAQLSIGMRQRVGLARAFVMRAKVLLMDEPFASVDALTRQELQAELIQIWQVDKMTVVFVTHSIDEALTLGTRVLVMSPPPTGILADIAIDRNVPNLGESPEQEYGEIRREISNLLGVV